MLLSRTTLDAIRDGTLTVVYRRWTRPTVRTGGTLRTAAGILAITAVTPIRPSDLDDAEARTAGYASREALLEALGGREGRLYRIDLGGLSPDPRRALQADAALPEDDVRDLQRTLARFDARTPGGPWTARVLALIQAHPAEPAAGLAQRAGRARAQFKRLVRKLNGLGLTISLPVGYRLSPRGEAFLSAAAEGPEPGTAGGDPAAG